MLPLSRFARCSATGAALACCKAPSVNNQPPLPGSSASFVAARRRNSTISTRIGVRPPNRFLSVVISLTRSVSGRDSTVASAAEPSSDVR